MVRGACWWQWWRRVSPIYNGEHWLAHGLLAGTCGGGSISLALFFIAIGSFRLFSWAIASGIASSRRRLIFSASALRAYATWGLTLMTTIDYIAVRA